MSFTVDLKNFAKKYEKNADIVVKKVVFDIGARVVKRTPVGDPLYWKSPPPLGYVGGRARANWQHGLTLKKSELDKIDKTGAMTIGAILGSIPSDAAGKIHYLSNNVPYIHRLESGTLSQQAPNGMVAVTIAEFDNIVNTEAKKVQ
jgi:hypothetical protein